MDVHPFVCHNEQKGRHHVEIGFLRCLLYIVRQISSMMSMIYKPDAAAIPGTMGDKNEE
ncbi:hypothetical protein J21TS7_09500 [Paenibacillus cineris]|uniref:Uncharacterized protein n=1 Tax=Paenibacillus cineris TaxID=237530 RepID=A0ABQ4L816_9BACL|nr:hypothetical protein J21TS7_09500 [Paenibacillus cineris]